MGTARRRHPRAPGAQAALRCRPEDEVAAPGAGGVRPSARRLPCRRPEPAAEPSAPEPRGAGRAARRRRAAAVGRRRRSRLAEPAPAVEPEPPTPTRRRPREPADLAARTSRDEVARRPRRSSTRAAEAAGGRGPPRGDAGLPAGDAGARPALVRAEAAARLRLRRVRRAGTASPAGRLHRRAPGRQRARGRPRRRRARRRRR